LLIAAYSSKHALGRVDNVLVELDMTYVPVDFIIMDCKNHSPIILGRFFLRSIGAIIYAKERNVNFNSHTRSA
jgi:hypothetical protein